MKKLAIVLAVLLVLLVALDRVGEVVAQNTAASKLEDSQHLHEKPDVDIQGFPFLTQAVRRSFGQVVVTADDVALASGVLDLSRLRVVLHDVTISSDLGSVEAQRADAEATIDFPVLSKAVGIEVEYAGEGQVMGAGAQRLVPELRGKALVLFGKTLSLAGIPFGITVNDVSPERDGLHLSLSGRDLSYGGAG